MATDSEHDDRERRCPRLGGPVAFAYCRQCADNAEVCFKILDCWWEYFDVVSEMKRHLSPEALQSLLDARAKPKITSLLEIVEQVKARSADDE